MTQPSHLPQNDMLERETPLAPTWYATLSRRLQSLGKFMEYGPARRLLKDIATEIRRSVFVVYRMMTDSGLSHVRFRFTCAFCPKTAWKSERACP